jgi:dihydrofolate reductase
VVAADEQGGIAKGGDLPWRLPTDLAHFKRITSEAEAGKRNAVFMGRVTWETIPPRFRPLPGRINLVLTGNPQFEAPGALRAHSIGEGLALLERQPDLGRIFCVGGGAIYAEAVQMPACRRVVLTRVHDVFDCDTFFYMPSGLFEKTSGTDGADGDVRFTIEVWERRRD